MYVGSVSNSPHRVKSRSNIAISLSTSQDRTLTFIIVSLKSALVTVADSRPFTTWQAVISCVSLIQKPEPCPPVGLFTLHTFWCAHAMICGGISPVVGVGGRVAHPAMSRVSPATRDANHFFLLFFGQILPFWYTPSRQSSQMLLLVLPARPRRLSWQI